MTPDTGLASHYCVPQDMNALKCVSGLEGLRPTDLLVSRRLLSMPTVIDDRFRIDGYRWHFDGYRWHLAQQLYAFPKSILVAIELAKYAQ